MCDTVNYVGYYSIVLRTAGENQIYCDEIKNINILEWRNVRETKQIATIVNTNRSFAVMTLLSKAGDEAVAA